LAAARSCAQENSRVANFLNPKRARAASHNAEAHALMETLLQDIRFGFRQLMKQPGFAALAIISMALGIGANNGRCSRI